MDHSSKYANSHMKQTATKNSKFLNKFPKLTRRLRQPAVALVSTDATWITFMKLRLDRGLSVSYETDSPQEALTSNPSHIEFEKPKKWVAPYPKYEYG